MAISHALFSTKKTLVLSWLIGLTEMLSAHQAKAIHFKVAPIPQYYYTTILLVTKQQDFFYLD